MLTRLNVTVIIDTLTPSQWIVRTLERLDQNQHVQLNHIFLQPSAGHLPTQQPRARTPMLSRLAKKLLYGYINRSQFGLKPCEPLSLPADLRALVVDAGVDSIDTQDVLVHLGDLNKPTATLPKSTHGTWTVKHHELTNRIEEAVLGRRPLLWIHLWSLHNDKKNSHDRVGSHSLPMQSFSITDVLSAGFGSLPDLIVSRINWLAQGRNPNAYEADQITLDLYPPYAFPDQYQPPRMSSIELCLRSLVLLCLQTKQRMRNKLQTEQWQLGFSFHDQHASNIAISDYRELKPPANTIWADPHLIIENNQTHVFFEELEIKENRGRIAWAVLTPNGFENTPVTVLEEEHHLSYPYIFKHNDDIYMVPETASNKTISLYKATQFPEQWERLANIMDDVDAADSTLFQHEGLWWLFTNAASHPSVDERDQLNLFYAEDFLSGDWHPHPMNPVVTGTDRARMAGNIYRKNGELFRPSQYGATRYGFGVNISSIHSLSKTEYKETVISRLSPTKHDLWIGCHSAIHNDSVTVIDRLRRIWR